MNKTILRKKMYEKRNKMSLKDVKKKSNAAFRKILQTDIMKYKNILVYSDFKNEVKTGELISHLLKSGKFVYLPVCCTKTHTITPVRIYNTDFDSSVNKFGICEPKSELCGSAEIDCAVVPGIVFDKKGNRIGFGGGYYDRFFSERSQVYKIGLCYDCQLAEAESIEPDDFDVPMDIIVTESRVINAKMHSEKTTFDFAK